MRGIEKVNSQIIFPRVEYSKTRGYDGIKVRGTDVRETVTVSSHIGNMDELSEKVVEAGTMMTFERHIRQVHGLESFREQAKGINLGWHEQV